jgi:hypothetical protein
MIEHLARVLALQAFHFTHIKFSVLNGRVVVIGKTSTTTKRQMGKYRPVAVPNFETELANNILDGKGQTNYNFA